jgi:putative CocE/NonD family hydrolase
MQMSTDIHEGRSFGRRSAPAARYHGKKIYSLYLPMRDNVRLAIDVTLPDGLTPGEKIPALLIQSRYWRSMELRAPFKWFITADVLNPRYRGFKPFFLSRGYALVNVDVRGTGASYGVWRYPWTEESVYDAREIVDWIISQPWSNGNVGGWGISYLGTTAELLAALEHPAVKALIPMFNHPDPFMDITFPGGMFNERFIRDWGRFDHELDRNNLPAEFGLLGKLIIKGVSPVEDDHGRRMLQEATREHAPNPAIYNIAQLLTYRDEYHPEIGGSMDDMAVKRFEQTILRSNAAIYGWGSWMDAGTADAVIRRFMTHDNAHVGAVGAWEHGGQFHASPYQVPHSPSDPTPQGQWTEMIRFLDAHLKDGKREDYDRVLNYYTMGAEEWRSTKVWPPQGTSWKCWYMDNGGTLSEHAIQEQEGEDRFEVDFQATTGSLNRWWELSGILNKSVAYPERSEAAAHMLTYTSPILAANIEITGHPFVKLYVISTHTDGAFFVYLEDVHPDGRVTYITEGILRAIHRKTIAGTVVKGIELPQHSYLTADGMPLMPGEVAELAFCLNPTSVVLKRGHRLRVSIAGHDEGTFPRTPAEGNPVITVLRNEGYRSAVYLPVQGNH